jgi:hypothetical protein
MAINCPTTFHIRDFIGEIGPDVTRPTQASALQLEPTLHGPYDFDAHSEDVEAKDVRTLLVRWFCEPGRAHLYERGAFVYAWGSFFCGYTSDDELEVIHAHAIDR